MNEPANAERNGSSELPAAIVAAVVIVLGAIIAILAFTLSGGENPLHRFTLRESESAYRIDTETPSPTPLPTSSRQQTVTPTLTHTASRTPAPTPSATATSTPEPTHTATPTATRAPTHTPTFVPTATLTPTPHAIVSSDVVQLRAGPMRKYDVLGSVRQGDALPVVGRTGNAAWFQVSHAGQLAWVEATQLEATGLADQVPIVNRKDWPPTPTPTPTRTPRPTRAPRIPRPVLLEPRSGARFGSKVRLKFSWSRRLQPDERVSLYMWTGDGSQVFDWWVSETDILNGGGAIHEEDDRVVYEVNSGFGPLPKGSTYWRVAVFLDTPEEKRQISPWSSQRRIVHK